MITILCADALSLRNEACFDILFIILVFIKFSEHKYGRKMSKTSHDSLPIPVLRALRKLGQDIRDARRRRRIPMSIVAQRAGMSRTTLTKIEAGDPGVAIANYAAVLFVLGLIVRLSEVADLRYDSVGQQLEEEALPKRVRLARSKPRAGGS